MDCIFCKIINGELPAYKIYEDKKTLAFLDINPVNHGHTLIISKKHYEWMYEAPEEIVCQMFILSKKLMPAIKDALKADFVSVFVEGIDVPHFHIHLIPRHHKDNFSSWPKKKYEGNSAEKVRETIENSLE